MKVFDETKLIPIGLAITVLLFTSGAVATASDFRATILGRLSNVETAVTGINAMHDDIISLKTMMHTLCKRNGKDC